MHSPGRTGRNPKGPLVGEMPRTMQSNRKLIWSPSVEDRKKTPAPAQGGWTPLSASPRALVAWDPPRWAWDARWRLPQKPSKPASPPNPCTRAMRTSSPPEENAQLAQEAAAHAALPGLRAPGWVEHPERGGGGCPARWSPAVSHLVRSRVTSDGRGPWQRVAGGRGGRPACTERPAAPPHGLRSSGGRRVHPRGGGCGAWLPHLGPC